MPGGREREEGREAEAHLPEGQHLLSSGQRYGSAGCGGGGCGPAVLVPSLPGSRGCQGSPQQPWGSRKDRGECSVKGEPPPPPHKRHQGARDQVFDSKGRAEPSHRSLSAGVGGSRAWLPRTIRGLLARLKISIQR